MRAFLQRSPMGSMIKVFAIYPSAFWRNQNLNGFAVGNQKTLKLTADSSVPAALPVDPRCLRCRQWKLWHSSR